MSLLHAAALLAGLFGVPLVLLYLGHRIRRASWRRQRVFRWSVMAHVVAMVVALYASLVPPIGWRPDDTLRGILGVWSLVLLPLVGAVVASLFRSES